jgi:hypothetical protein
LKNRGAGLAVHFVNTNAPASPRLTLCTSQPVHFFPIRRTLDIVGEKRTVEGT